MGDSLVLRCGGEVLRGEMDMDMDMDRSDIALTETEEGRIE